MFDKVLSDIQTIRDVAFLSMEYSARRLRGHTATLPLFCEKTFPWLLFFSVFDALRSSMTIPGKN